MASIEELRNERIKKIELLKERGMEPYPVHVKRDAALAYIREQFSGIAERGEEQCVAGRVRAFRRQGGIAFLSLEDGTGELQCILERDTLGEDAFSLLIDAVDIGDFISCCGTLGLSKRGEQSLFAASWTMAAKSIRPLPDKWHGLTDAEERLRRRYLDLVMSPEARERFRRRAAIISFIRGYLEEHGYLEVETPVLQPLYGGASAEPFKTHHNALDIDLFLRISDELYLKRLLVGGYPKVYEIAKDFRNEGVDATHYPEFTMLEFYESFSDAARQRAFVEAMLRGLVTAATGGSCVTYRGTEIDFAPAFQVYSYYAVLRDFALMDKPEDASREDAAARAEELGVSVEEGDNREAILDNIFKKACRPNLLQPTFIIDYPANMLPLAKQKPDNEHVVDAFQLVIGGVELVKAFSELNDPHEQRARLETQERYREEGDEEAQRLDEDFMEALEYGMPPAGGVGIGIDRLVMLLTDTHHIKETILFPTMRPR